MTDEITKKLKEIGCEETRREAIYRWFEENHDIRVMIWGGDKKYGGVFLVRIYEKNYHYFALNNLQETRCPGIYEKTGYLKWKRFPGHRGDVEAFLFKTEEDASDTAIDYACHIATKNIE